MGRIKAFKQEEPKEEYHIGTVEPNYVLMNNERVHCLEFINGVITKYGWRKNVYLKDVFNYIEQLALGYIETYIKDKIIGETKITCSNPKKLHIIEPIYLVIEEDSCNQNQESKQEHRLRNMELAFIYGAINQYDKDDKYDKLELLTYIVKTCKNYFDEEARRDKLRKKSKE